MMTFLFKQKVRREILEDINKSIVYPQRISMTLSRDADAEEVC